MTIADQEKTFTVQVPLRWADMDAYGHINNVTVFRLLEEARVAVLGCPPSSGQPEGDGPQSPLPVFSQLPSGSQALVAENRARYLAPLPYRGLPARVEVRIAEVTAASLTLAYNIYDPVTGTHCVSASSVLAFFNATNRTLLRLGKEERKALARYL